MDRRRAIDAALAAPFAQQALRVDYTTYTLRSDNAGRARCCCRSRRTCPSRAPRRNRRTWSFSSATCATAGSSPAEPTPCRCRPPPPARARRASAPIASTSRIPPGSYMMRTVVREPGGLLGSADRKLDVRGLSGPDVTVGDVILGSVTGSLPVRARAYAQDGLTGLLEAYGRSSGPAAIPQRHRGDRAARFDRHAERRPARRHRARQPQRHHERRDRRDPAGDVCDALDGRDTGRLSGARQR